MLQTLSTISWDAAHPVSIQQEAIQQLEAGQILYFPQLPFNLAPEEQPFLSPDYADPHAKNISYHAQQHKLWGTQHLNDEEHAKLKFMLDRFSRYAFTLIQALLPAYSSHLTIGRTSYRPVQVCNRKCSYRKDDKRLHVDAFPSAPNRGQRILRVFSNVNPNDEPRIWRVGEPFEKVARQFAPLVKKPLPGSAAVLRWLKITKSYRTLYDHYMLQIHDRMKADTQYQQQADQCEIHFAAGSTWIVQTDHVSHAAMKGQYVLEQTFYLPINKMLDQANAPLRVLENIVGHPLV